MPRSVSTPRNIPDLLRGVVFLFALLLKLRIYIFFCYFFSLHAQIQLGFSPSQLHTPGSP